MDRREARADRHMHRESCSSCNLHLLSETWASGCCWVLGMDRGAQPAPHDHGLKGAARQIGGRSACLPTGWAFASKPMV